MTANRDESGAAAVERSARPDCGAPRRACLALIGRCAVLVLCISTLSCATLPAADDARAMTGLKTRIETPLFAESVVFYTELIGLTVLDSWDEPGDRGAILGLGRTHGAEAFLEIAYADTPAAHAAVSLQFRVSDLSAVESRLRGRWQYRGPEARPWGSTYLYLRDPAGVRVIVYEGDL